MEEQRTNYYKKGGWHQKKTKFYKEKWFSDKCWFGGSLHADLDEGADLR